MKSKTLRKTYLDKVKDLYNDRDNEILFTNPVPKFKEDRYIGIEIECFVPYNTFDKFTQQIYMHGLEGKLQIGDDGSIDEEPDTTGMELRLLTTEESYKHDLKALANCLREVQADVNRTCGVHVHLDTQHMSAKDIVAKLVPFKSLFQSIIPPHRKDNEYCRFNESYNSHHNWLSYNSIGTVEVRCHEGTINMKAIERFINLLLAMKESKVKKDTKNLLDVLKLTKSDKLYFEKRMTKFERSQGDRYYV